MHIAIDARMYHIHGGHGRYLRELIKHLEQLDTNNRYTIILKPEGFSSYTPESPNFTKIQTTAHWYTLAEQTSFLKLLYKINADLDHFPHWNVPLLYRRPFIITIHDLILRAYPHSAVSTRNPFIFWAKYLGFRVVLRHALTRALHIITVSNTGREQIFEYYPELTTEITPIHLGAPPHVISTERSEWRNLNGEIPRLGSAGQSLARDDNYFLYIGTAYPHKNLPFLLHAFHQFGIRFGRTHRLILVGARSIFYNRLLSTDTAKTLLENGDLIYKEAPDDAALEELYANATSVICPALIEGFGLPSLEAAARGIPVIASRIPAFEEILGDAAIYIDPTKTESLVAAFLSLRNEFVIPEAASAIRDPENLLDSRFRENDNTTFRNALLSRAAQFSWRRTAEKTYTLYASLRA